jgi:transposase InsO family protein
VSDGLACHVRFPEFREEPHFSALDPLALGLGQRFTRPDRPQTNGKTERFIRAWLAELAYVRAYDPSGWRARALQHNLTFHNIERSHSALCEQLPVARLAQLLSTTPRSLHLGLTLPQENLKV